MYKIADPNQVGGERHAKMGTTITSNVLDDVETSNGIQEPIFPEKCGLRRDNMFSENDNVHFRVVKGSTAKPGEYPWQVLNL